MGAAVLLGLAGCSAMRLELGPRPVKPGDPVLVTVSGAAFPPEGEVGGRPLQFFETERGYQALAALSVDESLGKLPVRVQVPRSLSAADVAQLAGELSVVDPGFPSRELHVDRKFVEIPSYARKQIAEDRIAFAQAFDQPFAPPLFRGPFEWPRPTEITAPFGDLRLFNGKRQSQHYGTDLNGEVGDIVLAANDGEVVMARECYSSGGTVVLYHGLRLFTLYFHMSRIDVAVGQHIRRGTAIGQVGKTGRVTGPHLHFAVKIGDRYVNPATLLELRFGVPAARTPPPPSARTAEPGEASVRSTPTDAALEIGGGEH